MEMEGPIKHAGRRVVEFSLFLPFNTEPKDLIGKPILQEGKRVGYVTNYVGVRAMADDSSWRIWNVEYDTYHVFGAVLDEWFEVVESEGDV